MPTYKYFTWAFVFTAIGLALGAWLGWNSTGTLAGAGQIFFICAVFAVLEISLSFDNAIVNANKLKDMTPVWQRRFLTWGIIIAVFGMRIVFPLLIVVIAAGIGPIEALKLAVKLLGASYGDRAALTANLLDARADHAARLAHYEQLEREQFPDPDGLDGAGLDQWLVLRGGIRLERFWIDWITDYLHAHDRAHERD